MIYKCVFWKAAFLNEPELIYLHIVKWFQVLSSNTNCSICHCLIVLLYFFDVEIIEENTNFDSMMFYFGARNSGFYIKL